MDIIRQLKDDLADARKDDNVLKRDLRKEADGNAEMKGPYDKAIAKCLKLEIDSIKHKKIKDEFVVVNEKIEQCKKEYLEIEWEYEVKQQQFNYMDREKHTLFDAFHKLVYELHQKTGLRNLVLEKKLETIHDSLETKDA